MRTDRSLVRAASCGTLALPRACAQRALAAVLLAMIVVASAPVVEALGRLVPVIVVADDTERATEITRANAGEVDYPLPIVGGVAARIPTSRLDEVASTALVVPDRRITMQSKTFRATAKKSTASKESGGDGLVSAYPKEVAAPFLWERGVTGQGITVALVDTGVANVPDLRGRVIATANFTRERTDSDTYGHGTFQAGLIAGDGEASGGRYVGIAPGANLLSVKVADASGTTSLSQVLAGVQLVDYSAERFGVRVMLLAIDSDSPLPPEIDPLSVALRTVWSHGVVVVVPAGNDGPDSGTVASPGEDPVLLTAASVDDLGTPSPYDDPVSEFSARGPTRWGAEKPDVAAPGEHLTSLRAPGSTVDVENPGSVVEDAYFKGSGTSMSAAVTAGAAALVAAARPGLSPDEIKALLQGTATPLPSGDADSVGTGLVNAADAAVASEELPSLPPAPDLGDPEEPFAPRGLRFEWVRDRDGVWRWVARQWASRQWESRTWADEDWEELNEQARQWAARQWESRTWDARFFEARQWAARQWAARQWASRTWASRTWESRTWSEDEWASRTWASRTWASRTWESRTWASRTWASRQWASRTWTEDEWTSRTWTSRQWTSRQWESRSWESRSWESRQWASRQWASRTWASRSWA